MSHLHWQEERQILLALTYTTSCQRVLTALFHLSVNVPLKALKYCASGKSQEITLYAGNG